MPAVQAILVGLVMVLAFLASKIVAVAIERDYKGWAFPVARWTARLADSLQSSKRGSVLAEVLHAQHDENRAALPEALWHLVGAPLSCPKNADIARAQRRRPLWVHDKGGRFSTKGHYASAIVRGTTWETTEVCAGTLGTCSAFVWKAVRR